MIYRTHHFSPVAIAGAKPRNEMLFIKAFKISGPAPVEEIPFDGGVVTVGTSSDEIFQQSKLVSIGLFWLPVIPTVLNWPFPLRALCSTEVEVVVKSIDRRVVFYPWNTRISTEEAPAIRPLKVKRENGEIVEDGLPIIVGAGQVRIVLIQYPIAKGTKAYELSLSEIESEVGAVNLPKIPFFKRADWAFAAAP